MKNMKEEETVYGISVSYTVDAWNRCDVNIPMGVRVEDDSDSTFFKVFDENDECIFGVEKSRVISWMKGSELDEEESEDTDEENEFEEVDYEE